MEVAISMSMVNAVMLRAALLCALLNGCRAQDRVPASSEALPSVAPVAFALDTSTTRVHDIAVAGDRVVVAVSGEYAIQVYDRDGRFLKNSVALGEGPLEAKQIWGITPYEGGFVAWDALQRKLLFLSAEGDPVRSVGVSLPLTVIAGRTAGITYGRPGMIRQLGGELVIGMTPTSVDQSSDLARTQLVIVDSLGRVRDTLVDFAARADEIRRLAGPELDSRYLLPVPLWTTCGDTLIVADPYQSRWVRMSASGTVVRTAELRPSGSVPTDDEIKAHIRYALSTITAGAFSDSRLEGFVQGTFASDKGSFSPILPTIANLYCDRGRLIVQEFSMEPRGDGLGTTLWIGGPGGRALTLPPAFQPMVATDGWLFGFERLDDGLRRVMALPIPAQGI